MPPGLILIVLSITNKHYTASGDIINLMNRKLTKSIIVTASLVSVIYPVWVWYGSANLVLDKIVLFDIFPLFGLIAFANMWLHIVGGALRSHIEPYFDFEKFILLSSNIVLVTIILHPVLAFTALALNGGGNIFDFVLNGNEYLIWIAIVALVIFLVYEVLKHFRSRSVFAKNWLLIKFISTLGFFLILIHSLGIGRDLQTGPLRIVWLFYGITASIATFYTYFLKRDLG